MTQSMQKGYYYNNSDYNKLQKLGYSYNIMEGGWISANGATIISQDRQPYISKVFSLRPKKDKQHKYNINMLLA